MPRYRNGDDWTGLDDPNRNGALDRWLEDELGYGYHVSPQCAQSGCANCTDARCDHWCHSIEAHNG